MNYLVLYQIMLIALLALTHVQLKWKPPYTEDFPPHDYRSLVNKLGPDHAGIFIEGDRITFLGDGVENPLALPDWIRPRFTHDGDLWVAQAKLKDWDRAFFQYSVKVNGKKVSREFWAHHAPRPPQRVRKLAGSLQTFPIVSPALGESRDVTVYLPPHSAPGLNVVYMLDGQSCEDFAKILEPLILTGKVAPTAIVGLFHGEYKGDFAHYDMSKDFRAREYLKPADPDRFEAYEKFLAEEVIPWGEQKFAFATGATHRALFGFSNGAAFALVASVERPDIFGAVMPFSVAAYDRRELAANAADKEIPRYWFTAGTLESFDYNTRDVFNILRASRADQPDDQLSLYEYVSGHEENMWKIAFARCLPQIFPPKR